MKIGDIFEIKTKKGSGYLQYVKEPSDNTELEKTRIFYTLYNEKPELSEIVSGKYFFLEFPLQAAKKKKILTYIGNIILPVNLSYPRYFRSENIFGKGWRIIDSMGGQKVVEELTKEQKKMSPWGTWNDTLLIDNLEKGWRLNKWE